MFTSINARIAQLGPEWCWILRSCPVSEKKPGLFLANVCLRPHFFPVFADTAEAALEESFRRAELFKKEGVK